MLGRSVKGLHEDEEHMSLSFKTSNKNRSKHSVILKKRCSMSHMQCSKSMKSMIGDFW